MCRAVKGKRFWGGVILTAIVVGILCTLGVWQLQRLQWKNALIKAMDDPATILAAPNLPIEEISPSRPMPVLFFGYYRPEYSIFVRQQDRMVVYMPFQTDQGEMILMRRGEIPVQDMSNRLLDTGSQNTQVSVVGVAVPRPVHIPMMRETFPNGLVWSLMDWEAVQAKFSYYKLAPFIVQVIDDPKSTLDIVNTKPEIRNEHLHYAIFWFVMAAVALLLFSRFILFAPCGEKIERNHV